MNDSLFNFSIDNNFNLTFGANIKGVAALIIFIGLLYMVYYLIKDGKVKSIKRWFQNHPIEIKIDAFGIEGKLFPFATNQKFAWKLYIELATRVTSKPLQSGNGIYREALNSIYDVFKQARISLSEADPSIGQKRNANELTVLNITLNVLNDHLRPFLSKWHPQLQSHEAMNTRMLAVYDHEQLWTQKNQFELELNNLSNGLTQYVKELAKIADID